MTITRRVREPFEFVAQAIPVPGLNGQRARETSEVSTVAGARRPVARWRLLISALGLSALILAWAVLNIANGWVGFATIVPTGFRGGMEAAISLARLFAAMVLILIIADGIGRRLRWVASGFVILGLGQLIFGYIEPIVVDSTDINQSLYEMILVRALAAALIIVGVVPREPPRFTWRAAAGIFLIWHACIAGYWVLFELGAVPQLVLVESLENAERLRIAPMSWLTGWHWAFAAVPFGLAVVAAIWALKRSLDGEIGAWLPLAIILQAGSELHDSLWPSAYGNSMLMNTADVLRLSMAAVVVVGGALELRRIASERVALLKAEKERARRLEELTALKADFTAMVAHELGYPLSAIRRLAEMLSRDGLDPELRNRALTTIIKETDALDNLVADVNATAAVERDDFEAELRPVEIGSLIYDAVAGTEAYDDSQPVEATFDGVEPCERVLADPDRIGQVLRNILCNAQKYTPDGTHISLSVKYADSGRVRIEVADSGPGIHPDDIERIFEKFGRGERGPNGHVVGAGLGLYLSRRIVQAHGSDIDVRSKLGSGSIFAFELEVEGSTSAVERVER